MEDRYYVINGTLIHADQFDELYHAGRLGMKWGKHLPGTDWWKQQLSNYYSTNKIGKQSTKDVDVNGKTSFYTTYGNNVSTKNKIRANLSVAGQAAKKYANLAKGTAKAYGASARVGAKSLAKSVANRASYAADKVKKAPSKAYQNVRDSVHKFFESGNKDYKHTHIEKYTSLTHLEQWMKKEQREAAHAYVTSKVKGGLGSAINTLIQSGQMKFAVGVNQLLKKNGMTTKVDKFLSKFLGDSGYGKEVKKKYQSKSSKASRAQSNRSNSIN